MPMTGPAALRMCVKDVGAREPFARALNRPCPALFARAAWPPCSARGSAAPARGYMAWAMSDAVIHNAARHRFELDVDGQTVFTEYRLSPGVMTFFHTLTPPALRGRGLAARVVQAALFTRAAKD